MNSIKIVTKLDFRALKYCNLFIMKYKRNMLLYTIILFVLPLIVIFFDIFRFKYYYPAAIAGLYMAWLIYRLVSLETKLDQDLARYFSTRRVMTHTVEISDEKILLYYSGETSPIDFDWSFITEIYEMPQYYVLMAGRSPIIIDRRAEAVLEGSQEDLTKIINEKAQTKPHKKVEHDIVKKPITFVHPEFPEPEITEADEESKEVESVVVEENNEVSQTDTEEEADAVSENGTEE